VIEAAYDMESDEESWSHSIAPKIKAHCGDNESTMMVRLDTTLPPEQRIFRATVPGKGKTVERDRKNRHAAREGALARGARPARPDPRAEQNLTGARERAPRSGIMAP